MAAPKKKPALTEAPRPINRYGQRDMPGWTQFEYDRLAFSRRFGVETGAPTRVQLFKRLAEQLLPNHFEWHDWFENRTANTLCENALVGMPGCSNAGKTFGVVGFAVVWWMIDPNHSSVTLISTTRGSLRRRGWSEVSKCYAALSGKPEQKGRFIDSRMVWQAPIINGQKSDDKHAIIGRAVEEGSTQKVADDIKGVHTRRQMVIIDEATSVPFAIYEACANLYSYPISSGGEFVLVLMGNPLNRLDQFGRFCEPEDGWNSVTVDSGEWDGRPQETLGGLKPRVVTFDAEKSPNIVEDRIVCRHLPTKSTVESAKKYSGGGSTPSYWQNFRGFWPPEGLTKTVFSEADMRQNNAYGKHKFTGRNFSIIGAFDHARDGGDRPCLGFAKMGEIEGGHWGIEIMPPIIIPLDANSSMPIDFQLTGQIKRQCQKFIQETIEYECLPENFGMDATGGGADMADIVQQLWSGKIIRVVFGEAASEDAVSLEDSRRACDAYINKRTEMYFRGANMVQSGQLKGIDRETASELVAVQFVDMRTDGTSLKRVKLMSKKEYKLAFKKSPDLADRVAILCEVARRRGFVLAPMGQTVHKFNDWETELKRSESVYVEAETYQQEEDYELVEDF